jgi:hypothetical protein
VFITEHESGHGKLVLLVVSEPQYYEFAYFIQCLIRKRQQSLVTQLADGDDNEQAAVIKPAGGGGVTDIAWALDGKYLAVATEQGFAGILPTAA